jgi:NAD(P)-dependent dehydrogenase (short-subunit alcohol dehydrogenase family)
LLAVARRKEKQPSPVRHPLLVLWYYALLVTVALFWFFAVLQKETGFSNVHLRLLDLALFSSVTEFANKFEQEEERLDIFVANAALGRTDYIVSEDGWESRYVFV